MDSPTRLFLLRHAEVEERYHRVFGGRIDMELSPRGHEQAVALAAYLRRVRLDTIYASPMKRVQQTLHPMRAHHAPAPVIFDELREVDFGAWTGLRWEEVHERFSMRAFDWLEHLDCAAIPEAESAQTFRERVEPCLRQILQESRGRSVAIVSHGGVIRMLLSLLLELPIRELAKFEIDYASLTQIDYLPHKAEVQLLNFTPWRDLP